MSMCESILTIALVCTVKYLHYCDYYYTLGNDSQSTPKLIAYQLLQNCACYAHYFSLTCYTTIFSLGFISSNLYVCYTVITFKTIAEFLSFISRKRNH